MGKPLFWQVYFDWKGSQVTWWKMRVVIIKASNIKAKIQVLQGFQPLFPKWFWQVSYRTPGCDQQSHEQLRINQGQENTEWKLQDLSSNQFVPVHLSCLVSHLTTEQPSEPNTDEKSIFFLALIRDKNCRTVTQGDLLPLNLHGECFASGVLLPGTNPSRLSPQKRTHWKEKSFCITAAWAANGKKWERVIAMTNSTLKIY